MKTSVGIIFLFASALALAMTARNGEALAHPEHGSYWQQSGY